MRRSRSLRVAGNGLRFALFLAASIAAARFLVNTVSSRGWGPGALFGMLLFTGALLLVWRATIDLRKAIHRRRA